MVSSQTSNINDNKPCRIVATLHIGFHVSGWKSLMDKQSRSLQRCQKKQRKKKELGFEAPTWRTHKNRRGFIGILWGETKLAMIDAVVVPRVLGCG